MPCGGYWLFRQLRPSPALRVMLAYLPRTLFVSYVVPALVGGGTGAMGGRTGDAGGHAAAGSLSGAIFAGDGCGVGDVVIC